MTNATRNTSPLAELPPRTHTHQSDSDRHVSAEAAPMPRDSAQHPPEARRFPGWRWVAVALAFPIAGYIGWKVGGRVDSAHRVMQMKARCLIGDHRTHA